MRIESLLYFIVTAKCHSMSDASILLDISHQCISRELKSLEAEMGEELFLRSKKGVQLTDKGRIAYNRALDVLQYFYDFKKVFSSESTSTYTLAYYTGLKDMVEDAESLLLTIYPDTFFSEFTLSSGRSLEFIQEGKADFIVTQISKDIYSEIANDGYNATVLYHEPLLVALHKSRYQKTISNFDLDNLKDYPIAFYIEDIGEVPLFSRIAQQFGWKRIVYNGNDQFKLWKRAAEEGACLLLTSSTNSNMEIFNDFVILPVKQDISILTVLFTKKDISTSIINEKLSFLLKLSKKA